MEMGRASAVLFAISMLSDKGSMVVSKVAVSGASNRVFPIPLAAISARDTTPDSNRILHDWISGVLGAKVTAKVFDFPLGISNSLESMMA